jgi:hypothetical protein
MAPDMTSDMPSDDFDDRLLDRAAAHADELLGLPDDAFPGQLRERVKQALSSRRPDGTWPPAELLIEVLRLYLAVLDERPLREGRWIDAWQEAATSPEVLQRLLDELRDFDDTAGILNYPPDESLEIRSDPGPG